MDILEILDRYAEGDEFQRPIETAIEEITKLREQVAAQAAVIAKLRDALGFAEDCWFCEQMLTKSVVAKMKQALAIPTDSTQALDVVRRAERERVYQVADNAYATEHVLLAIRAME